MNNLNNIIQKSLGLINYDRSKHITEQVAPKKPLSADKINIKDFTFKGITRENDDNKQTPFVTMKSVVVDQNIYIPSKKVVSKEKTPIEKSFMSSLIPDIPTYQTKVTYEKPKIIKTINGSESFNRELAEQYFGSQCLKLSGKHPTYDVGYSQSLDYFVSNDGRRCVPIPYKSIESSVLDPKTKKNKIDVSNVYQYDLKKSVKLKNGNTIQKSKFKYENGCKTLTYDECLKLSWEQLFSIGSQIQGVYEVEVETESLFIPMKNETKGKKTYIGCISDEWFPWFNRYVGYIEKSQYKVTTDSAGIKQGTKCLRKGTNQTGINLMENSLGNLSSKVFSSSVIPSDSVESFSMNSAFMESLGKDYEIKADYYNYTVDLNQWFVWGEKDYYKGYAGIDRKFSDYVNTQNDEENIYDAYLNNLYGVTLGGSILPQKTLDNSILKGFQAFVGGGEVDLIRDERTYESLQIKYTSLEEKYDSKIFELLKVISKDYVKENEKVTPNKVVIDFLINKWNEVLNGFKVINFDDFMKANKILDVGEFSEYDPYGNYKNKEGVDLPNTNYSKFESPKILGYTEIDKWQMDDFVMAYHYKKFGISDDTNLIVKSMKSYVDRLKPTFNTQNPFVIVSDYTSFNKKGITPLSITDTYDKSESDGKTNGFLYVKVEVGGKEFGEFTYKKLLKNVDIQTDESDVELTDDEKIQNLEFKLKQYNDFDTSISDILKTTLVIMGR
jgi:hypothetical protein